MTAGADLTANGQDLDYLMNAPTWSAPENRRQWVYAIRRNPGTGGTVALNLRNRTAGTTMVSSGSMSADAFAWQDNPVPSVSVPSAADALDSQAVVAAGASGRVSISVLRLAVELRTASAPDISNFTTSQAAISPNADGVKDSLTMSAQMGDVTLDSWTLRVKNSTATVVRTFAASSPPSYTSVSIAWDGKDTAGVVTPDGSYTLELEVRDQSANITIQSLSTVVDTVAPTIRLGRFFPQDHGNTIFTSQPLTARFTEEGSGLDASTLWFWLTDTTTGIRAPLTVASFSASNGVAISVAANLTLGRVYRAETGITDIAGNTYNYVQGTAASGGGFLVSNINASPASVSFDSSAVNTGNPGVAPNTVVWSVTPRLTVENREINFTNGSRHVGYGTLVSTVPLDSLVIETKTATTDWTAGVNAYAAGTTRQVLQQFAYVNNSGAENLVRLPADAHDLTPLNLELSTDVTDVRISSASVTSTAGFVGVTASPTFPGGASPDPLRFYITKDMADKAAEVHLPGDDPTTVIEDVFGLLVGRAPIPNVDDADKGMIWETFFGLLTACTGDTPQLCWYQGVGYPNDTKVFSEVGMGAVCPYLIRCAYVESSGTPGNEAMHRWWCIDRMQGYDLDASVDRMHNPADPDDPKQPCSQSYRQESVAYRSSSKNQAGHWLYELVISWGSDWGFQDGPKDEIGVHFNTADPQQRWTLATAADASSKFGASSFYSIYATPEWVGIYPQDVNSTEGYPYSTAIDAYWNAMGSPYYIDKVYGALRQACDLTQTGATVCKHGFGSGSGTGTHGWKQYYGDPRGATSYGGFPVKYRTRDAQMTVVLELLDKCRSTICKGQTSNDGHLNSTWGHTYSTSSYSWDWLYQAVQCGTAQATKGSCDWLGLVFSTLSQQENKRRVAHQEVANAFSYE